MILWLHIARTCHFVTSANRRHPVLQDPEAPIALLRNVCFMCDSNGIQALQSCFERATPETLPVNLAHLLLTLISNVSVGIVCMVFLEQAFKRGY